MTTIYTKKEIIGMVDKYLQSDRVNKLNPNGFVNYR